MTTRQNHRITVLSPHLDDAALSSCEHILARRKTGDDVAVISVFTSFRAPAIPCYQERYLDAMGIATLDQYDLVRKKEDIEAMEMLGVAWRHLEFTDATFRFSNGQPVYKDVGELFAGGIAERDMPLNEDLVAAFRYFGDSDFVLVPLGVGSHPDHLLVRRAAEECFEPEQLAYYVDQPYARNPLTWRRNQLWAMLRKKKRLRWPTARKRRILSAYRSRMPFLLAGKPRFPEIWLGNVSA